MRTNSAILLCIVSFVFEGNVRAQSPDFQSLVHVFPQFVDGSASENRSYTSTLQVSAADFSFLTRCTLGLLSMPATTLIDARGLRETDTIFNFILGASGWQILQSQGTQSLRTGIFNDSAVQNICRRYRWPALEFQLRPGSFRPILRPIC